MRKTFEKFVTTLAILFICGWPLFPIVAMICDSANTTTDIYTATCEVIEKYETQVSKYDSALSLLSKVPMFRPETEQVLVVEYEGECYEIKVDEELYDEIEIGEQVECEVKFTHNQHSQEANYEVSKLKEN